MIITGMSLLAGSAVFLLIGAVKANFRPLMGAAVMALGGIIFIAIGTVIVRQGRRQEPAAAGGAFPTGAVAAAPLVAAPVPAAVPLPAGIPAAPPGMVPVLIYVPAGTPLPAWAAPPQPAAPVGPPPSSP